MDEMTLLRSVHEEVAGPSRETLDEGRARLLIAASPGGSAPKRRPRRALRRVGWTGVGVVAAIAVIATLVATNVVGLAGWRGGADQAAADTLDSAAAASISNADPVVAPGQYLHIATTEVSLDSGDHARFLTKVTENLYIPADKNDDWVWVRPMPAPYKTFGPASAAAAAKEYASQIKEFPNGDGTLRAKAGGFYGGAAPVSPASVAALPTDPTQLLNHIYLTTVGQGNSPDDEAFVFIADTLRSGIVPADVRAALYRAAAMIPGVTITEGQATLDGRTGVAIAHPNGEGDAEEQELIIDPSTGLVIGERYVLNKAEGTIPAGTVTGSTSVLTSVVDTAPKGGTVCGDVGVLTSTGCQIRN